MTCDLDIALAATAGKFSSTFGETVTFKPDGGEERSIEAIVTREPAVDIPGAPHGYGPMVKIDVENNATTGISSSEIDTGRDHVSLALRIGETAQDRRITGILSHDAGRVIYEVR